MNILEFSDRFDAIVVLKADLPEKRFFEKFQGIPVFAADGAALKLDAIGVIPDKIVGDMDSLREGNFDNKFQDHKLVYDPDQNSNDFEKTLKYCELNELNKILVVGIHGGEYEHSINNWSVFTKFSRKLELVIYDERRYGISIFDDTRIETSENEIISIIPNGRAELSTKNLRWELINEYLTLGEREGARNRALENHIEIFVHFGSILLFIDARLPYAPKKK